MIFEVFAAVAYGIAATVLVAAAVVAGSGLFTLARSPRPGESRMQAASRLARRTVRVYLHPIQAMHGTLHHPVAPAASDPALPAWPTDLVTLATSPLPRSAEPDAYLTQMMRTLSPEAYRVWLPHMSTYLGKGRPGQPLLLSVSEMAHLADWYALAGDDAPVYAMSRLTMPEAATHIARGDGVAEGVRALALQRGWYPAPHQGNQALGA